MRKTLKVLVAVVVSAMLFGAFLALITVNANAYSEAYSNVKIVTSTYEKVTGKITNIEVQNEICYITLDYDQVYAIDDAYEAFSTAVNFTKGDNVEITYNDTGSVDSILNIVIH